MFDLPTPERYRLDNPPLVLAVAQVNYPILGRLQSLEGITPLQEAIRGSFPYMQMVQVDQLAVVLGPTVEASSPATAQRTIAWRFTDDAGWTLNINPASAQLAVGKEYTSVEDMERRLRVVLEALVTAAGVPRCDRLGVRFIDFAQIGPGEESEWRSWFRPEIVGWTSMEIFSEGTVLQSTLQQTVLVATSGDPGPANTHALIRNGLLPAGTVLPKPDGSQEILSNHAYVLDQDMFVDAPQPMEVDALVRQFRAMHLDIDRFFRLCLSPVGEVHFALRKL